MALTAAAIIGAVGATASAASSIYSTATRDQSGPARQQQIANQQLDDTRRNDLYQQLVSAMINQRSVAGSQDSFGSTLRYDPGSNTWVSKLGELPQAADTSAMQATIRQNTTQARMAELANEQAAVRAARAGPAADQAQRELANFRPMQRDQLTSLLMNRGTTAANEVFRPMTQETLRNYTRTGVNAGPVMSELGRTQNDQLRKSLMDAQIAGMTGTDQVNESRRTGLENAATTATAFANPAFQATAVAPSAQQKNLADLLSARSYSASTAPAYGAQGVNAANKNANDAFGRAYSAAGIVPSQPGAEIGNQLSKLATDKNLQSVVGSLFDPGGFFNRISPSINTSATNSAEQNYYDTYNAGKTYTQPQF
jgi:hypothetical protein